VAVAVSHIRIGEEALVDTGCALVAEYVRNVGQLALLLLVALHLLPMLADRTHCVIVALRQSFCALLIAVVPMVAWLNDSATQSLNADDCWDQTHTRSLAIADIIVTYGIVLLAVWYGMERLLAPSDWWNRRFRYHTYLVRSAGFVSRRARLVLLVACIGLMVAGLDKLYSYNDVLVNSYHWSFTDRPAPCEKSCQKRWRPNKRSRKCMNAKEQVIPIQYCLDHLQPLEMLPSNHLMLQQCPMLTCTYPNGESLRYHWSMRNEQVVRSNECTKHDRRLVEQVGLVQEFGCFDEHDRVWVDEGWCSAWAPPFAAPGKTDSFRLIYWKDKHCLNRCETAWRVTWMYVVLQSLIIVSILTTWIGQRQQRRKMASGLLASATPLPTLAPRALRQQLRTGNARSWFVCRVARVLWYVHLHGLSVLSYPARLATSTLLFLTLASVTCVAFHNMIWLSDSHCRFFSSVAVPNAAATFVCFTIAVAWILRQMQTHREHTPHHPSHAGLHSHAAYEDR
jgi:hypothetical protein